MERSRIDELLRVYRAGLLEDVVPFWTRHGVDREHGGFLTCLDRDGTVLDTDKGVWVQARATWLFATLYLAVERREEWLELARGGIQFMRAHCFDTDGRMFFQVTRDGRPLRKRRYVFTEAFGAIAFAAWARASGDGRAAEEARALFRLVLRCAREPERLEPKGVPGTRPTKSLGMPMILLATAQVLRATIDEPLADECIERCIEEIRRDFMRADVRAVMETVGPNGERIDHFDGRLLNPGHALEAAWFMLEEARHRGGDAALVETATTILDWTWERGWDAEHGGILYFCDVHGLPVQEYWHDMKFWWPQTEAIQATLMAHLATGEERYERWHMLAHDWAYAHFPDPEHGEWFGYLHRDGRLSVPLKGNLWKGPFHLPRMQLYCWKILERAQAGAPHGDTLEV